MRKIKLYLLAGSALLLLGCGEEFSTAGVSLGGSGTGIGHPEPTPPISGNPNQQLPAPPVVVLLLVLAQNLVV